MFGNATACRARAPPSGVPNMTTLTSLRVDVDDAAAELQLGVNESYELAIDAAAGARARARTAWARCARSRRSRSSRTRARSSRARPCAWPTRRASLTAG